MARSQPPSGVLTDTGLVGLRLGREGLRGKAGGRQRLLVEPCADIVAFLGGFLVALGAASENHL